MDLREKLILVIASFLTAIIYPLSMYAVEKKTANGAFEPMVVQQFLEEAKKNENWKIAFATGKHEQIVFMNISSQTNPKNEIGMEVHSFDQVIFIVQGRGRAVLNGKATFVNEGDMIFVPQGTNHNVVNLNDNTALKVISFYSDTDIPKGSVFRTKADEVKS